MNKSIGIYEYYENPRVREICHLVKKGDEKAIMIMAKSLANRLPDSCDIIPVPNSSGKADYTLKLANEIIKLRPKIGCKDVLEGIPRISLYEAKKQGIPIEFGFKINTNKIINNNTFLIDNVIGTGTTMMKLRKVIGKKLPVLAFAVDTSSLIFGKELSQSVTVKISNRMSMGM